MKYFIYTALLAFTPELVMAQYYPGTPQDIQSHPNVYTQQKNPDGTTSVNGSNPYSGSSWQAQQHPNGDMTGTNAQGQHWTYDSSRGVYENPQAGLRCVYSSTGQRICP